MQCAESETIGPSKFTDTSFFPSISKTAKCHFREAPKRTGAIVLYVSEQKEFSERQSDR